MELVPKSLGEGVQAFLDKCPDYCMPIETVGFKWSKPGIGFGEVHFYFDNETGQLTCDSECISREFIKQMLCKMVDDSYFPK